MILLVLITIPLIATILSAISRKVRFTAIATLIATLVTLALTVCTIREVLTVHAHIVTAIPNWIELGPLGSVILLLIAFVVVMAALFSIGYMDFKSTGDIKRYYVNFNLFVFSMLIVPLIQEASLVWIAVELTTIFSVLLVGFANTHDALEAAWKYVVLTLMGASIALLGFLILFWASSQAGLEHYTWSEMLTASAKMSPVLLKAAFIFILVGFGAKIGLVPLHTWLPDAHSQAPTPVCALLSGVETTVVLYVILRILPVLHKAIGTSINNWLIIFGLISVGTAAFLLLQVKDYKRLFAFSTVEHMGIILVAVGLGGTSANSAALLQIIAHSLAKSFCFFVAGSILFLTGTTNIASVRNLIGRTPAVAVALLLAGLAIAGAPPFALFLSEFSILKTGINQTDYLVAGLLALFIIIAFFAIMGHISRMVFGAENEKTNTTASLRSLPVSCSVTIIITAVPVVVLGVYIPGLLQKLILLAATTIGG